MDRPVHKEIGSSVALDGERRQQLVRTAAREFAHSGFEQASLNAVIRQCGMSKSSFYHVIDSKLALYEVVIAEAAGSLVDELALPRPESFAGEYYWEHVIGLVERLTHVLTSDSIYLDLGRILYGRKPPRGSVEATRVLTSAEQWIHNLVQAGRDCGAIRTDLPASLQGELAFATLRTFDDWSIRHHDEISPDQVENTVEAQIATLRRLLAPS